MFWGLHIPFGTTVLEDGYRPIRITGAVLLNTSKPLAEDTVVMVYAATKAGDKPVAVVAFDNKSGRRVSVDLKIDEDETVTFTTNMTGDFGDGIDFCGYYVDDEDDDDEFGEDDVKVEMAISKLKNRCFLKYLNEEKGLLEEDSKCPKLDNK